MKTYHEMTTNEFKIEALESRLYRIACEMQNIFTRSGYTIDFRYLERKSANLTEELKKAKDELN